VLIVALLIAVQSTDFGIRQVGLPTAKAAKPVRTTSRAVTSSAAFSCAVRRITDGDTLRCTDGTKVRIAGIDAPEITECRPSRQCVAGDANASKRSLAALAEGRTLSCERVGTSYDRVVAFCSAGGVDLSCAQVRAGQAVTRYSEQARVCR
jgi:endonuclease YncB( thermonuclease family)